MVHQTDNVKVDDDKGWNSLGDGRRGAKEANCRSSCSSIGSLGIDVEFSRMFNGTSLTCDPFG